MKFAPQHELYTSYNINKSDIEIKNEIFDCHIFWFRLINSETESLFTRNTQHTFYEIQYALSGQIGMVLDETQKIYVEESEFILIPPNTYHQIVDAPTVGSRFIMAFSLQLKNEKHGKYLTYLNNPLPHQESAAMRSLISMIIKKNYHNNPIRSCLINSMMEALLLEFFESIIPASVRGGLYFTSRNEMAELEAAIRKYIAEYSGIGITVTDVAKKFNFSERHLNRLIKDFSNCSTQELIHQEKLKKIEKFIVTTELSLEEIAQLCGFMDSYAMNKFFRRHNKISPSEFRQIRKPKS